MPAQTLSPAATPHRESPRRLGQLLLTTAVVVVVLGVLPVAWHASVVWQVLGPLVAAALVVRTAQVGWRQIFSTDPRHLGTPG